MYIEVDKDTAKLGCSAAAYAAQVIRRAIDARGEARVMLATGMSQLLLLEPLVEMDIDWSRVVCFHQDEYIGLKPSHPASFVGYLQKRVVDKVSPKAFYPVDGTGDVQETIARLSALVSEKPIDLAFIGFGENAHIAFNDPPADFETNAIYKVVELEERCKRQQVGEGWFASLEEVPTHAITLTVPEILRARTIVTFVPYQVKAEAVRKVFANTCTPDVPATALKSHADWHLYLDADAASQVFKL